MKKSWRILIFFFVLALITGGIFMFLNGYLFRFLEDSNGKSFNETRLRLGQPIIESYFVSKKAKIANVFVWVAPDSLKPKVFHQRKDYWVDLFRRIKGETDYYNVSFPNEWIKSMSFDTITYEVVNPNSSSIESFPYQTFKREYYFQNDSVNYEVRVFISKDKALGKILSRAQGDSVIEHTR